MEVIYSEGEPRISVFVLPGAAVMGLVWTDIEIYKTKHPNGLDTKGNHAIIPTSDLNARVA